MDAGTTTDLLRAWPTWRERLDGRGFLLIQIIADEETDALLAIDGSQTLLEAEPGDAFCALTIVLGGESWTVVIVADEDRKESTT